MCTPLVDQPYGYVRLPAPMLDLAEISTEFSGALEGVTAMPRGLHARLCHAFLGLFAIYLLSLFFRRDGDWSQKFGLELRIFPGRAGPRDIARAELEPTTVVWPGATSRVQKQSPWLRDQGGEAP